VKIRLAALVLSLGLLVTGCAVLIAGSKLTSPAQSSVGSLPPDLPGKSVSFQSGSGAIIRGWLIPGRTGAGAVALMHGVRANRLSMLDRARFLARNGFTVLLFDFQAHGESEGKHLTFGHLESEDAKAAISFLRKEAPNEKIGIIGVSMGGAATLLASPPLDVNAIVLEMVYPNIDQAVKNRITMRLGGWSAILSPLLTAQLRYRLGFDTDALRPIDHVGSIKVPKLFIVGANDKHTTIEESRQMYEAASQPKELWVIENAAHVDFYRVAQKEYEDRVLTFFRINLSSN